MSAFCTSCRRIAEKVKRTRGVSCPLCGTWNALIKMPKVDPSRKEKNKRREHESYLPTREPCEAVRP